MANEPIPAATLVVFRDADENTSARAPELLMVERAKAMAFAGGAMVFPGGRIDPGDHAFGKQIGGGGETTARIAAIRETIEEAGVAIGLSPAPLPQRLEVVRGRLGGGEGFADVLADEGLTLDLDRLVPFARWLPAHAATRIFDTLFFIARAPDDADATVDATENVRLIWTSAADMLAAADAGNARILYPTRRNLERLALFGTYEEAVAQARAHPVRTITPVIEDRGGTPHLCIPEGLGYPVTAEPIDAAMRG